MEATKTCKKKQSLLITSLGFDCSSILNAKLDAYRQTLILQNTVLSQSLPWCHLNSIFRKVHTINFISEMELVDI